MTDKRLTMKELQAQIDDLRKSIDGLAPIQPVSEPQSASALDMDEYERVKTALSEIESEVAKLKDGFKSQSEAMGELKEALSSDIEDVGKKIDETKASIPSDKEDVLLDLRQRIEALSEELAEARQVVQGLRATSETDLSQRELQDKKYQEMKKQADAMFARMVKVEQGRQVDVDNFKRFQKERRNEGLFIGILAAVALGFTAVVLALALAGVI